MKLIIKINQLLFFTTVFLLLKILNKKRYMTHTTTYTILKQFLLQQK